MKSCFGYVRVSTQKQGEGVSLEAQRDAILAFASRSNLSVIRWFEEKETAAKSGRPVFTAMIKALHRGEAHGLIIHKIDRSARNFADWAKIGELSDQGIDVHFASESLDFRSRGGRLTADIQAVIAADYIRNLREETKKGMNGRLKQGLYPWKAPIGYLDQGGGKPKIPDPVRAPLIVTAFEHYVSGQYSMRALRDHLRSIGLVTERSTPVSKGGLEQILGNPFYAGTIRITRTGMTYPGIHEPLIPQSLFDRVQEVKAGKTGKKTTKHLHLYRGLFRCQRCELALIPERQKGYVYYRCHTPGCVTKCVRQELLEASVIETLSFATLTDSDVAFLISEVTKWAEGRQKGSATHTISMQIAAAEQKLDRLTDALIDKVIDSDTYAKRKERVLFELSRLRELRDRQAKAIDPSDLQQFLELIKILAQLYKVAKPIEKREMVEITTSNRSVLGKAIYVEPQNWLHRTQEATCGLVGAHSRPTSRSSTDMRDAHIETLIEVSQSPQIERLRQIARPPTQTSPNVYLFGGGQQPPGQQDHK